MLQPASGQPARAVIQPDGTFVLTTYRNGDGASLGHNQMRVTCFEGQAPQQKAVTSQGEVPLGKSLIPTRYTRIDTSGLAIDVTPDMKQPLIIEIED